MMLMVVTMVMRDYDEERRYEVYDIEIEPRKGKKALTTRNDVKVITNLPEC